VSFAHIQRGRRSSHHRQNRNRPPFGRKRPRPPAQYMRNPSATERTDGGRESNGAEYEKRGSRFIEQCGRAEPGGARAQPEAPPRARRTNPSLRRGKAESAACAAVPCIRAQPQKRAGRVLCSAGGVGAPSAAPGAQRRHTPRAPPATRNRPHVRQAHCAEHGRGANIAG